MDGFVTAKMDDDWCLIEFEEGATGQMWRLKVQGNPEKTNSVPFEPGTEVTLTQKEQAD